MNYSDKRMIKAMNAHKKGIQGSIEEGIFIMEKLYTFEEITLFDNKMQIMFPQAFTDMPLELAKLKYPMEQRPQIIKTNERTDVNFTFSILKEQPLENENVKWIRDSLRNTMRNMRPDKKFMETGLEEIENLIVGWFEFISNGYDGKLYNFMYFVPIEGKMMQGILNCPAVESQNRKTVILQMIQTIKDN